MVGEEDGELVFASSGLVVSVGELRNIIFS